MRPETRLQFYSSDSSSPSPAAAHVLGVSLLGQRGSHTQPWPALQVLMPLLANPAQQLQEYWHSSQAVRHGQFHDVRFGSDGHLLYGAISLDEALFADNRGSALQHAAEQAYRQLFSLLEAEDCRHLWRVWNYIPRINAVEHGMERYRQFNIGRHQAFADFDRPVDSSPAACALGVADGPLSIAFLAARQATQRIENPRQVSAFAYPQQYGPRSPTFSRAALADNGDNIILFISGTASIVGHRTVHPGDAAAQTRETIANIAVLLEQANRQHQGQPYTLATLDYRVYIRHATDYPAVQQTLQQLIGPAMRVVFMQADICRDDLLVEIEAQAFAAR
ncbi:hypothetical protein [Aquitalea aquatilis]|uniref:chorismate transformation enzyme, FkbO/Hyg5 family n=1 Tax=Aquitalea aquatilis TaxID=1537400 RepID=UPI001FE6CFD2|nr:hypothetical protein [Aquitalea aquatilis]